MNLLSRSNVVSVGITRTLARRTHLTDLADFCWQIESGIVRTITWNDEGDTIVLGIWGEGDLVGSILTATTPHEMQCLTDVTVKLIPRDRLMGMSEVMLDRIKINEEFFKVVRHRRIDRTIVGFLSWLAHRFGRVLPDGIAIDFYITHQEIADAVGTTRVTCSRTITKLVDDGKIKKRHRRYIIPF